MTSTIYPQPISKKRVAYLDLFRLLSAMAVVMIHLTASAIVRYEPGSLPLLVITCINGLMLFAVPAFIFISAYTFMFIYADKKMVFFEFLKKRLAVLIIPYTGWTLLYYLDQLYFAKGQFELLAFLKHLLLGTSFYHLYFMVIIFQFYLLFIPLKWLFEKFNGFLIFVLSLVAFYVYTAGLPFSNTIAWIASINDLLILKSDILYSDRFFMSYLPFYTLGIFLAYEIKRNKLRLSQWIPIFVPIYLIYEYAHTGGRIAYYVYQQNFNFQLPFAWEISSALAILLLLGLCQWVESIGMPTQLMTKLSAYTFTLYLAHPLILQICEIKLVPLLSGHYSLSLIITLVLALSIPLIGSWTVDQFKQKG